MDAFSYTNIFDTKGIEYLVIIAFLLLIIPFWQIISRPVFRQKIKKVLGILSEKILRIPRGLQYSRNHTWTHMNKSGDAVIGIDDLLNHLLGEVDISPLHESGDIIEKGEKLAELKQDGKKLNIFSPISGKLLSYNSMLINDPTLINTEPYDNGWLAHIEPKSWKNESADLLTGEEAVKWESEELMKFKDFLATSAQSENSENKNVVLQEGGEIIDQPLSEMSQEVWTEFQKQFLNI